MYEQTDTVRCMKKNNKKNMEDAGGNVAVAKRFEELIRPAADEYGFKIIRTEYVKENGNYYLRAFIDKEGGVTIDDCVLLSRRASKLLDKEDYISESYTMEISSPGFMTDGDEAGAEEN